MRVNSAGQRIGVVIATALAFCLLGGGRVWAQTQLTGKTGGAYYSIVVPVGWVPADGLVIWLDDFNLGPIAPEPGLGPLSDLHLSQGFAVATTTLSDNYWATFKSVRDLRKLMKVFRRRIGDPLFLYLYGEGFGGLATAQAIEKGRLGNVVGAMPMCGAVAGSRFWDGILDLRLLYDYVCDAVLGASIPGASTGLPKNSKLTDNQMAQALNVCTGVLVPEGFRTAAQQARLDRLLTLTDLPVEFVATDMGFATFGLADLVFDPRKLADVPAFDNSNVDYGDPGVNANINRVKSRKKGEKRLAKNYTPNGRVKGAKIVSIHTDKDGLVIVENESEYASVVPPGNLTVGIIVEDAPTHCGFTQAETVAAWESLRGWVAGGGQPEISDLLAKCNELVAAGLNQGPCRFDEGFRIPDMDGRVRPR